MRVRCGVLVGSCVAVVAGVCRGADWPEWRGPGRDGIVRGGRALIDGFAKGAPREVWRCKGIEGHANGGYGSVAVADARVYVYANTRVRKPQPVKVLTRPTLRSLGWTPELPDTLRQAVEQARVCPERAALAKDRVGPWVKAWLAQHLTDKTKRYTRACAERLKRGPGAMPLDVLGKLATVQDKKFAHEAELRAWLAREAVPAQWRAMLVNRAAVVHQTGYDDVFCIDATTGALLWTKRYPGRTYAYQCSSTPCIAGGRCYVAGSGAMVYCLDAATGKEVWKGKSKASAKQQVGASFVVEDGVAVLLGGVLMGFDAAAGTVRWTQNAVRGVHASPARWRVADRTRLVCNSGNQTVCVDPRTGDVVWRVPGGGLSTPAIAGDRLALYTSNKKIGLAAYRLSTDGAKQLWRLPYSDRGSSPVIHDGFVYAIGGWQKPHAVCVNLDTGKLAWQTKVPQTEISSPVVADGKIWYVFGMFTRTSLYCLRATPTRYTLLGAAPIPVVTATSAAIADGRLYLRLPHAVACYDLRK